MAEIALFHSALGLRAGINVAADRLRAAGHTVHVQDYFPEPRVFDDAGPAVEYIGGVGWDTMAARAMASVSGLPADVVYAGFSVGAGYAAALAANRPGARAAILLSGAPNPERLKAASWPANVPVQIHAVTGDQWVNADDKSKLASFVAASGSACAVFDYPGSAHLFADPSLPNEFDPMAAELMWTRVVAFLAELDQR